jgi:DNA-directed RNA polymerase sigma subunit (sigma70/sigma32)
LVSNKRSCQTKRTVLLEQEIYENIKDTEIFSPVEHARMSDCREIISEVIDRNIFSEKQKRVLRMKFLSSDEIIPTHDVAKKFGMKYCTVSNIIRGSVKKIKKILIEEKKLSISF